jgi:uncharacterized protein with LGFP repeats
MKMFISILIAGALSTASALAGAAPTSPKVAGNDNAIATPKLAFRPVQKKPAGARQAVAAVQRVNVGAPQMLFRPYQKGPTAAPASKPSVIEAANRQ